MVEPLNAAAIDALLRAEPFGTVAQQVDVELRNDPVKAFAIATEAEYALVRMTVPWCAPCPLSRGMHATL